MPKRKRINPFYVLLVLIGVLFTVTACAYGVMAFRASQPRAAGMADDAPHPLLMFVDRYGAWVMIGELAVLGICTFAAIGLDQYWTGQDEAQRKEEPSESQ